MESDSSWTYRPSICKNKLFPEWPVKPAIFLWPGYGQPILPAEFFGELVCESKLCVVIRVPELCEAPPCREFGLEKFPDLSAKGFFFLEDCELLLSDGRTVREDRRPHVLVNVIHVIGVAEGVAAGKSSGS